VWAEGIAVRSRNAGPIDNDIFGTFGGDAIFSVEQAQRVEKGVGDVGESSGAAESDAIEAREFENSGEEAADLLNVRRIADIGGGIGEGIIRGFRDGVNANMGGAKAVIEFGDGLAAVTTALEDVETGGENGRSGCWGLSELHGKLLCEMR
jgi:hypothetical protein